MRLQITHLKAPWPPGAVVGDVLDLPAVPAWALGKCVHVGDDVALTIGALTDDEGSDTVTGDGTSEALPIIEEPATEPAPEPEPVKAKRK